MAISARFHVTTVTAYPGTQRTVKLTPAYANGANKEWATATPSGTIELGVNNPAASDQFTAWMEDGKDVAITFEAVDRPT